LAHVAGGPVVALLRHIEQLQSPELNRIEILWKRAKYFGATSLL
jgi:hypothetical protein